MHYLDFKASVAKLVKDWRSAAETAGIVGASTGQLYNFDAYADSAQLPDQLYIYGQKDFSLVDDDGTVIISVMLGAATFDDTNLNILDQLISVIYNLVKPGQRVDIVDRVAGTKLGNMTAMTGTTVFPVDRTQLRPRQFVGVHFGVDLLTP